MNASASMRIPLYLQPKKGELCGPVCVRMLLEYFRVSKSLHNIHGELPMIKTGVRLASMGTYFLAHGFGVQMIVYHHYPQFPGDFIKLARRTATKHIRSWCDERPNDPLRKSIAAFIDTGGKILPRPVTEHDIKDALSANVGVLLNVNPAILYGNAITDGCGHYVIPTRMNLGRTTVNDPAYGKKSYPTERLMLACHRWSAGALFVSKK